MKYGIISDIHGNIIALKEVLKKFDEQKVNKIICCGDVIGIGPEPESAIQELIKNENKLVCVKGNHEKYLLEGLPKVVHDDKREISEGEVKCHLWNQSQLSKKSKDFISTLKDVEYVYDNNKCICITHYPMKNNNEYMPLIKEPTLEDYKKLFRPYNADIYVYGHTHKKVINNYENKLYINPGSLGCPLDTNYASCGILNITDNNVEYIDLTIEYDTNKVIQDIEEKNFPMLNEILDIFYGGRHLL